MSKPLPTMRPSIGLSLTGLAGALMVVVLVMTSQADLVTTYTLLGFSIFSAYCGFSLANHDYVSMERAAQVAALLLAGPISAVTLSGCISLLSPWFRESSGNQHKPPVSIITTDALQSAFAISTGILVFYSLGGSAPFQQLSLASLPAMAGLCLGAIIGNAAFDFLRHLYGEREGWTPLKFILDATGCLTGIVIAASWLETSVLLWGFIMCIIALSMLQFRFFGSLQRNVENMIASRTVALSQESDTWSDLARTDELTGLRNRREANERLRHETEVAAITQSPICIAILDLDHFKQINDTYSHVAGDTVLKTVALTLKGQCRAHDLLARHGGEEFLIGFFGQDLQACERACERIRASIEGLVFSEISQDLKITTSIGLAQWSNESINEVLQRADIALYQAKHDGRNCLRTAN